MKYLLCCFMVNVTVCHREYLQLDSWQDTTVQCRDNNNRPVKWWIIYKPPVPYAFALTDSRFAYVTSNEGDKWKLSTVHIDANAMLQNTLYPLVKKTYKNRAAVLLYGNRSNAAEGDTIAKGIMISDFLGGFWMGHTVPGFPHYSTILERIYYPEEELPNGNIMVCLSLNVTTLNVFVKHLKIVEPKFEYVNVPQTLKQKLREWDTLNCGSLDKKTQVPPTTMFNKLTDNINVEVLFKNKKSDLNIYTAFELLHSINMNGYGFPKTLPRVYLNRMGVIKSISLKTPGKIYYVGKKLDRMKFAMSTRQSNTFWTCFSNMDMIPTTDRGLLVCFESIQMWNVFRSLVNLRH